VDEAVPDVLLDANQSDKIHTEKRSKGKRTEKREILQEVSQKKQAVHPYVPLQATPFHRSKYKCKSNKVVGAESFEQTRLSSQTLFDYHAFGKNGAQQETTGATRSSPFNAFPLTVDCQCKKNLKLFMFYANVHIDFVLKQVAKSYELLKF